MYAIKVNGKLANQDGAILVWVTLSEAWAAIFVARNQMPVVFDEAKPIKYRGETCTQ